MRQERVRKMSSVSRRLKINLAADSSIPDRHDGRPRGTSASGSSELSRFIVFVRIKDS
jgi:hypothetical protein